ncbi:DedA family protein [Vibrio tritonius]|uniref:DedA family protein n=1 Tax=Vibrio tritonius TaxID=1435069 RepID=UPI00315C8846
MSLQQLVAEYGYLAVAIGTFFEGETILVLGGFAAHRGYLDLFWVIASAFGGTLFGDQLYYFIGRSKGKSAIDKRPKWKAKSDRVFHLLNKHQVLLILGFRFLYGIRTVTPFLIGASNVPPQRFIVLNIIGALIWAIAVGVLGYLFGHTVELFLHNIKHYEVTFFAAICFCAIVLWSWKRWKSENK